MGNSPVWKPPGLASLKVLNGVGVDGVGVKFPIFASKQQLFALVLGNEEKKSKEKRSQRASSEGCMEWVVVGTAAFGAPPMLRLFVEKCCVFQGFGQTSGRPQNGRSYLSDPNRSDFEITNR